MPSVIRLFPLAENSRSLKSFCWRGKAAGGGGGGLGPAPAWEISTFFTGVFLGFAGFDDVAQL